MASEMQACVEAIADRLALPVSLVNPDLDSLVFSPHPEDMLDEVRRDSILMRTTAPWVREWFAAYGVGKTAHPVRVEPHPEHSTHSRWIVPVRRQGVEQGFVCVLDPHRTCDAEAYATIADLVEQLADLLYEEQADRMAVSRHLFELLTGSPAAASSALDYIEHAIGVEPSHPVIIVTSTGIEGPCTPAEGDTTPARVPRPTGLLAQGIALDHHIYVVSATKGSADVVRRIRAVGRKCCGTAAIGTSEARPLRDSSTSYDQARAAMSVAARLPDVPDTLAFDDLGAFRFLANRSDADLASCMDPRVRALVEADDPELLRTLERYLAQGCDTAATVADLNIHRGTLYYRLKKVDTLDLASGTDRLTLHIGLLANELLRSSRRPRHPGPVRLLSV